MPHVAREAPEAQIQPAPGSVRVSRHPGVQLRGGLGLRHGLELDCTRATYSAGAPTMTEHRPEDERLTDDELIEQARKWPRDGFGEGRWFHAMADRIEQMR